MASGSHVQAADEPPVTSPRRTDSARATSSAPRRRSPVPSEAGVALAAVRRLERRSDELGVQIVDMLDAITDLMEKAARVLRDGTREEQIAAADDLLDSARINRHTLVRVREPRHGFSTGRTSHGAGQAPGTQAAPVAAPSGAPAPDALKAGAAAAQREADCIWCGERLRYSVLAGWVHARTGRLDVTRIDA
jgi:ParB-like chromosome segregation protein Spo0J